jgi:hypothetical protein
MKLSIKITLIILIVVFNSKEAYSQEKKLDQLRTNFCGINRKAYTENKELELKLRNAPPPPDPSEMSREEKKLVKLFSIPLNERLKLFPFSKYDSIYIAKPNYLKNECEPRNYLDEKFHASKRLLTKEEISELSNIFFNYYLLLNYLEIGVAGETYSDRPIKDQYPKIIILFIKNGKAKDFIAFPNKGYKRASFNNKEIFCMDLCDEKEGMILKLFGIPIE